MKQINYKSDFKLFEKGELHAAPFEYVYSTTFGKSYKASYLDGVYTNCRLLDDGRLMVVFDNHELSPGILRVTRRYYLTDSGYHDGICHLVSKEGTGVILTDGKTDDCDVEVQIPPHYMQGEQGVPGKDMTWDSMAEEQRTGLIQEVTSHVEDTMITSTSISDTEYEDFFINFQK